MANTLSVMTNVLRNVVSKQRIRYKEKGFNLDLAYICENIIAMGYPADNIESFYRNRLEDVYKFLEENHREHYKIYNLCLERSYDINKFHGRVAVYPFEDHNPPTIELIQKFCYDVDCWLKSNSLNVAAIHCKAGKGRTGTMICCYLLYSGLHISAEDALACYDEKRTKDRKGVTIPSQRRYVQYFAKLIQSGLQYEKKTLQFCEIRFADGDILHSHGMVNCSISVLQDTSYAKIQTLQTFTIDFRKNLILEINNPCLSVTGDIKVELTHKTSRKKFFHFWFNTYFVCDTADIEEDGDSRKLVYTLYKNEIDAVHKDKDHKSFSEDFKVQVVFQLLNSIQTNTSITSINAIKPKDKKMHHNLSQPSNENKFKALMPQVSSSADVNNICYHKSSSSTSARCLNKNMVQFVVNELATESSVDGLKSSYAVNNIIIHKCLSANIKTNIICSSPHYNNLDQSLPPSILASSPVEDTQLLYKHNQLNSGQTILNERGSIKKYPRPNYLQYRSRTQRTKDSITRHTSNASNRSHHLFSASRDDKDKYWEFGEFSQKPHTALNLPYNFNINTNFNLDLSNTPRRFENKVCGNKNRTDHIYSMSIFKKPSSSNIDTIQCMLLTDLEDDQRFETILVSEQHIFQKQLSNILSIETNGNQFSRMNFFGGCKESLFPFNLKICNIGSSALVTTSKQILAYNIYKNNIKLWRQFERFNKYARIDAVNFCNYFMLKRTATEWNIIRSLDIDSKKLSVSIFPSFMYFPEFCYSPPLQAARQLKPSSFRYIGNCNGPHKDKESNEVQKYT